LVRRGATLVAANLRHGKGEIDLLVQLGGRTVAVEVKTRRVGDPLDSFTADKRRALGRTAAGLVPRPSRIDLVAISAGPDGVAVRWVPGAA